MLFSDGGVWGSSIAVTYDDNCAMMLKEMFSPQCYHSRLGFLDKRRQSMRIVTFCKR